MPLCVAGSTNLTVVYFRPLTSATVLGFHSMFEFLFWNSISFKEQLSQLPCFSDSHQNIKFNYTNIHNDNSNQNKRIILIHWLFSPARDISAQAISASFVILRNLGNITMPRHRQGIRGEHLGHSMPISGSDGKEFLQCRKPGFNPWVRNIPWKRRLQPTPIFLPGEPHGQRRLVG